MLMNLFSIDRLMKTKKHVPGVGSYNDVDVIIREKKDDNKNSYITTERVLSTPVTSLKMKRHWNNGFSYLSFLKE